MSVLFVLLIINCYGQMRNIDRSLDDVMIAPTVSICVCIQGLSSVMNSQTENIVLNEKRCSQWLQQKCLRVCMWRIIITLKNIEKKIIKIIKNGTWNNADD